MWMEESFAEWCIHVARCRMVGGRLCFCYEVGASKLFGENGGLKEAMEMVEQNDRLG